MENWIKAFYDAVDSSKYEVSMSYYADDVKAQLGNKPTTVGKDALIRGLSTITDVAKGTKHQFLAEAIPFCTYHYFLCCPRTRG